MVQGVVIMSDLCLLADAGHITDSELASAAETIVAWQTPQLQACLTEIEFLPFIPMLRLLRRAGLSVAGQLQSVVEVELRKRRSEAARNIEQARVDRDAGKQVRGLVVLIYHKRWATYKKLMNQVRATSLVAA